MGKGKLNKISEGTQQDSEIDPDFIEYIRGVVHDIDNDDETRVNLINNFISEIPDGKESIVAQHTQGSKILDSLIGFTSAENFESFTGCLKDSRRLMLNKNSSFVLESCVKIAAIRALSSENEIKKEEPDEPESKRKRFSKKSTDVNYNLELEFKPSHIQSCNEFILKLAKFALNNIEDLIKGQGNHFIRTCLLCLSGIVTHKFHDRSPVNQVNLKIEHGKQIPDEWIEVIKDFSSRLQQWPHFHELAFDEKSSTFLQVLCQALHNTGQEKSLKKLIKKIMKSSFDDEDAQKPFSTKCSKFLLESMLQFSDEKQFTKLYEKYFKGKVTEMAGDIECNFTIQRLLDYVKNKEIFEEIFNQLSANFSSLLQNGRTGVVLAVAKACERLSFKQGQLIQSIIKALECEKSPNCVVQCIVTLMPASIVEKSIGDIDVHLHGSLILQSILRFNKPIKIVQSILEIKPQTLSDIFCHPKGSRVADAFVESKFIGEKSREKLIKHLEGMYLKLALSKNGSHVLEKLYQLSSESQKEVIVKELAERLNQLNGSGCGRIISYKFNVEVYSRNVNQWKNFLSRT
jgi:nucleolar protein 9